MLKYCEENDISFKDFAVLLRLNSNDVIKDFRLMLLNFANKHEYVKFLYLQKGQKPIKYSALFCDLAYLKSDDSKHNYYIFFKNLKSKTSFFKTNILSFKNIRFFQSTFCYFNYIRTHKTLAAFFANHFCNEKNEEKNELTKFSFLI